jgi:hypothetical protein
MRPFIPRFNDLPTFRYQLIYFTVSLCGLYDDLVSILSLGMLRSEVRAAALFDWFEEE